MDRFREVSKIKSNNQGYNVLTSDNNLSKKEAIQKSR